MTRLSLFTLLALLAAPALVNADYEYTGKYLDGGYNVGQRDQVRFFAVVVDKGFSYKHAFETAKKVARSRNKKNRTHERLWDYNTRQTSLRGDQYLLIGYTTSNGRFNFLAQDRFGHWITYRESGNFAGWTRKYFPLPGGGKVYLQVTIENNVAHYQFDRA